MLIRIKNLAAKIYLWALVKSIKGRDIDGQKFDAGETMRLARRELNAIGETVIAAQEWQKSEQQILSERLARRYDPGMALNESAARAIEAKKAAKAEMPAQLGARGTAALEFQKKYLAGIIAKS